MLSTRGAINSLAKKTTQEEKKNLKNILIKRKKVHFKTVALLLRGIIHRIKRIEIVNDSNHKSPNTTTLKP